ncbi:RraA family protein [Mesorhizobium marinum]|uniref:RraA family protein n=1 Tax=Mesorhizobium marinum TaxID=3228790 RepID=UPI003467A950
MSLAARLAALGTATIGEVASEARAIDLPLRALAPAAMAGPAITVRCRPGDNLALHRAIAAATAGDVLVVDYGGSVASGPFGEIMALACQLRGIAGMVIDGSVRDSTRIAALGFPVFCRGLNIRGTTKQDRGDVGAPVTLGGTHVRQGDFVIADADAIIVLPAGQAEAAATAGEARVAREDAMMDRLRAGETTLQILGLNEGDER